MATKKKTTKTVAAKKAAPVKATAVKKASAVKKAAVKSVAPARKTAVRKTAAKKPPTPQPVTPAVAPVPAVPIRAVETTRVTASSGGLRVTATRGDGSVLLAMNFDQEPSTGFAGFAIHCTTPKGDAFFLKNRLSFTSTLTATTTPAEKQAQAETTDTAPYQKFRWLDFSSSSEPGTYTYAVSAMYHKTDGTLEARATATVSLQLGPFESGNLKVGFTRGMLSSQAYVDEFNNADIRPKQKSITYSTAPFEKQYAWLGFHARKLVFDFLNETLADSNSTLDVFAYDLDEPDIIALFQKFGKRLRAVLDDAPLHTKPGAMEILAKAALIQSAGAANIVTGHFKRFSHCKVLIRKVNGQAVSVLTGSANFSVRGLYVQANNVLVFNDPDTAGHYETAFEQAFQDMSGFASSEIAENWIDLTHIHNLPDFAVAFSPHKSASVSLDRVSQAIANAKSSVLFAIMELGGSGSVMDAIKNLGNVPNVFTYGVTQNLSGVTLCKPGSTNGILTPFSFLSKHVPPPFDSEVSGGPGQVIHNKFIVVDFNTDHPSVFTGSSNLAAGGEEDNGDNLLAITDPALASIYAAQALGLVDHFHFRSAMQTATDVKPLALDPTDAWWKPFFQQDSLQFHDRTLFCP